MGKDIGHQAWEERNQLSSDFHMCIVAYMHNKKIYVIII